MVSPLAMPGQVGLSWRRRHRDWMQRVGGEHDGARRTARTAARGPSPRARCRARRSCSREPPNSSGIVQALQAHLLAHLAPDGGVVAGLGLHLLADGGLGALGVEERAHGLAQLFLFFGEGKVHGDESVRSPARRLPVGVCTHVYTRDDGRASASSAPIWPPPAPRRRPAQRVVITVDGRRGRRSSARSRPTQGQARAGRRSSPPARVVAATPHRRAGGRAADPGVERRPPRPRCCSELRG